MAQVQKEAIRQGIHNAATRLFYEKGFRGTKMKDIARIANIPVGLVYTYYANKSALFDAVVQPVYSLFEKTIQAEEASPFNRAFEKFENAGQEHILAILRDHQKFVILVDRSAGTVHEDSKEKIISTLEQHIKKEWHQQSLKAYDDMLIHILASNFTESILEIARHYKNEEWAKDMLMLVAKCYYEGVNAL